MIQHYTINPLVWAESLDEENRKTYTATTSRGDYGITESEWMEQPAWYWEYKFCSYYDEDCGYLPGATAEEAKKFCEELWAERVKLDLKPVEGEQS